MADEMVNQTRASCSCSHVLQSQRPSLFLCAFGWRYWRFSLNVCGLVLALTVLITVLNSVWLRGLFPVYRQIWQWSISSCLCAGLSVFACVCAPDSVYRQCLCVWVHVQMRERERESFLWIIKLLWGCHCSVSIWQTTGTASHVIETTDSSCW